MTTGEYLHYRNWQMLQVTLSHPFPTAAMPQAGYLIFTSISLAMTSVLYTCLFMCLALLQDCEFLEVVPHIPGTQHNAWHIVGRQIFVD